MLFKKFLIIFLILSVTKFANAELLGSDKPSHIAASAMVTSLSYSYFKLRNHSRWESFTGALALGVFVGVAKEVIDSRADFDDLKADGIGVGAGLFLSVTFDFGISLFD